MARNRGGPVPLRPDISAAQEAIDRRVRRYRAWAWSVTAGVFMAGLLLGVRLGDTNVLLASLGLLSASLLGVFTQLAMWRSRLSERAARFVHTERFDRSRIDNAVSLTLRTSVVALGSTIVLAGSTIKFDASGRVREWVASQQWLDWTNSERIDYWAASVFSSAAFASLAWIFVSVTFITVDLWMTYRKVADSEEAEARAAKAHAVHKHNRSAG